jgi:hypothetical protein
MATQNLRFLGWGYFLLALLLLGGLNWIFVALNALMNFYYTSEAKAQKGTLNIASWLKPKAAPAKDLIWFIGLMHKPLRTATWKEKELGTSTSNVTPYTAKEKQALRALSFFQFAVFGLVGLATLYVLIVMGIGAPATGVNLEKA